MNHMEQKILETLVLDKDHPRSIAKKLNTNHTKVIRLLRELYNANIVDFKIHGKNKVYHLKDNIITRKKILALEQYKFEKLVRKYPELVSLITEILNVTKSIVILFGSYAKLRVKKESDIDLYVDTNKRDLRRRIEEVNSRLSVKIGRFDKKTPLGKEIVKNHIMLRGAEQFYEKYKIFEEIAFGE